MCAHGCDKQDQVYDQGRGETVRVHYIDFTIPVQECSDDVQTSYAERKHPI